MGPGAVDVAERRADEQRRREQPPRASRARRQRRRRHFQKRQEHHELQRDLTPQDPVGGVVAVAEDVRTEDTDDPHEGESDHRFDPVGKRQPLEPLLGAVERQDEHRRGDADPDPHPEIVPELPAGGQRRVGRRRVGRVGADQRARDDRADGRGDDDRTEALEREVAEDDLEGEQGAADRRVVGGGDPGGGAAAEQDIQAVAGQSEAPAEERAEGRPDADQGPLAPERPAGRDRDDGRTRLEQAASDRQDPAALSHRLDDARRAVPAYRLARDQDDEPDQRAPGDRDEKAVPGRGGQGVLQQLVARSPEQVLRQAEQPDEGHRREAGRHTGERHQDEKALLARRARPQRRERPPVGEPTHPVLPATL